MGDIVMSIIKTLSLFVNLAVLMMCLPRRKTMFFTVLAYVIMGIGVWFFEQFSGGLDRLQLVNTALYFPLSFYLFKVPVFQTLCSQATLNAAKSWMLSIHSK